MATATQLRSDVDLLTDEAFRDLGIIWRDLERPEAAETALRDILPALIDAYGAGAAALAADFYDDLRAAAAPRGRRFAALAANVRETGAQALVGWALAEAKDVSGFQGLIEGGTQKRIANFARFTVMESSIADPASDGWQRVSRGGCSQGFCDMLAGRGAVYSEASADFAAHDNCKCYAVPAWSGEPRPVKPFTPSLRNVSDADRARVRDWLATH